MPSSEDMTPQDGAPAAKGILEKAIERVRTGRSVAQRLEAASDIHADQLTYRALASDDSDEVRLAVAANSHVTAHTLYAMNRISSPRVQEAIQQRRLALPLESAVISDDECPSTIADDCSSTGVHCPICGMNYVRERPPYVVSGNDKYEAGWSGRGDLTVVPFIGECDHSFELCFGFHKGFIRAFVRLILPSGSQLQENGESPASDSLSIVPLRAPSSD